MVNVPWCHDCGNPDGLCTCDDASVPEQDFRDYHHGVVAELQKTIAAKDATIERLVAETKGYDELMAAQNAIVRAVWDLLGGEDATRVDGQNLVARVREVVAERDEAREALKPFAEFAAFIAEKRPGWDHDDFPIITMDALAGCMHMFAFRRARQALGDT